MKSYNIGLTTAEVTTMVFIMYRSRYIQVIDPKNTINYLKTEINKKLMEKIEVLKHEMGKSK